MLSQVNKAIKSQYDNWLMNIPYAYVLVVFVYFVSRIINQTPILQDYMSYIGLLSVILFVVLYLTHFEIPRIRNWNNLTEQEKKQMYSTWGIMILFILAFIARPWKTSSIEFVIHIGIAYVVGLFIHHIL